MPKFLLLARKAIHLSLYCSLLLLSACATTTQEAAREDNSIETRAQARWDAILQDDMATAYEYLSPGFRSSVSLMQYTRLILNKQVSWTGARYVRSECDEALCEVTIALDYALIGVLPGVKSFDATKDIEEAWLFVDDEWYYVPK
jgi:hypothetical protein